MRFSAYMDEWLYGEDGYYKTFKAIGKSGDFYTAVSTSRFFGASIANHFYKLLSEGKADRNGWLIEVGAHQGYLLCDMIQWLYTCDPTLIETLKFGIVERQPEVQKAQLEYIKERFGEDIKITHFDDIDDVKAEYAFVVANEIFDAFPCELLKDGKIAVVDDHTISWEEAPANLLQWAQKHYLKQGEVAVGYEAFAKAMAAGIGKCDFVSFDYGEKYVRNDFSIRVYRKHETFPLFDEELKLADAYQKDDITYDVNFGHVIESFEAAGFAEEAYETQARALIRFGLIDILEMYSKQADKVAYVREADKIKTLIAPTMMGDRFKMVHFRK
ncbi:SAM-dependent methyltransferase [Sulfurovum sp.]|uniref:SAM-dependent methyltransferase n=1 Tax=Sulfurovum sp. TaxID=1969726 RepID=UPI002A358405|nr:SAM-dependent methyltransferase [Sulfurovum sp.]MDD2450834.1 SAM-dependent methyltransferase [Sulfurovum sp.]MDD3498789.1 SAM-dependent methyltransferase [Sulfurovum sp.]MDY0402068.1 SAM-dependent methyltransferase [Sulfurovum sp.]